MVLHMRVLHVQMEALHVNDGLTDSAALHCINLFSTTCMVRIHMCLYRLMLRNTTVLQSPPTSVQEPSYDILMIAAPCAIPIPFTTWLSIVLLCRPIFLLMLLLLLRRPFTHHTSYLWRLLLLLLLEERVAPAAAANGIGLTSHCGSTSCVSTASCSNCRALGT
jgi:hypothetical protein